MASTSKTEHRFRFYRVGGVDQVQIKSGRDLVALEKLDQKLWVALSCPVKGLHFDERTLSLIDADGDGRVRARELLEAIEFSAQRLSDVEQLAKGGSALPLSVIASSTEEGKRLRKTAKALLKGLDKADAKEISVEDTVLCLDAFNQKPENGDGIVPPSKITDPEVQAVAETILSGIAEPKLDRSGEPGLDRADVLAFFDSARAHQEWSQKARAPEIRILGDATDTAFSAYAAVREKIDDFFTRVRVVAFDERALPALNRNEAAFDEIGAQRLDAVASSFADFPLAHVEKGATLPLVMGINPAWTDRIADFRANVVTPLLGEKDRLTDEEYRTIKNRWEAHRQWYESKPTSLWQEVPGFEALLESDAEKALLSLIEKDEAAADLASAIEDVERLVRYRRDLLTLANNFVSFRDFYRPGSRASFQSGSLYIDQRALDLCMFVDDVTAHAALAATSATYLLYCSVKNSSGVTRSIVAAVTGGEVDNLTVGRNGVFYDREGKDWDATVTRIIESPVGVGQAFWSPYKKLIRLIEEQVNKRAATAQEEADAKLTTKAVSIDGVTQGKLPPAAPKKLDIGVVAALGVAVGGITAALGVFLQAFLGLGIWMPLGILGILLAISGPSMGVAWLKLRRRNIGPLLDANGWAVNVLPRVNLPLGHSLTSLAVLPKGASRNLTDPFAEKKKPWWLYFFLLLLLLALVFWTLGKFNHHLPTHLQSTTVLSP